MTRTARDSARVFLAKVNEAERMLKSIDKQLARLQQQLAAIDEFIGEIDDDVEADGA
jgi:hypothetical protein